MIKLYTIENLSSLFLTKRDAFFWNVSQKNKSKLFTGLLVLFVSVFGFNEANAQVNITRPNLAINTCTFPSAYSGLGTIIIREPGGGGASNANFAMGAGRTLILTAPTNFEFNPGSGITAMTGGADITIVSTVVSATTITITYNCTATATRDRMEITNIQVRAINTASTGDITRTGGTGVVNGLVVGTTLTNTLTSTVTAITVQPVTPAAVCAGSGVRTISVTAPGAATYQWRKNGTNLTNVAPYSGVTTATLTITNPNISENGAVFDVLITPCALTSTSVVLTVNPQPAAIGGGAATVCIGATTPAFTNATIGGTWSTSNGNATINASGIVTGVTAGAVNVIYTLGSCSSSTALTVNPNITTLATTPVPANAAAGVCALGGGAITDISWTAAAGAVSYDVYFGTIPVPVFTVNQTSTTYSLPTSLLPSTTYYWKIVPIGPCGISTGVPIVWSFTTSATPCYCPSVPRNVGFNDGITRVQFNTINNVTSANAGNEYTDYTGSQNTNVIRGSSHALNVWVNTDGNFTQAQMAWIDWNQNGDFTDAGESSILGTATNVANGLSNACPVSINVPVTALLGVTRMRVSSRFNSNAGSCDNTYDGEVEDYSVTVIAGPPCTTPANQPTALILTPGGTFINGSFTAATSAPDHYLVIINTTGVAPTPTNGTTYNIGDNIGGTNVIVDTDNNTTFVAGQLSLSTTYFIYVFSYNTACSGGPLYNTTSPLNGTTTTTAVPPTYCTPVTTSAAIDRIYVSRVEFVGTLLDTSNISTTDGTPDGFQDFTGLAPKSIQAQGGPINMKLTAATSRGFWKVWVDWNKDGDFADAGEEVYNPSGFMFISTTFGFIVPTNTTPGDYRMRVRVQNTIRNTLPLLETGVYFDSCNPFNPLVIGGVNYRTYGEAEDYLFTVIPKCDNNIATITNPAICGAVSGTVTANISATSTTGTINWYDTLTGGTLLGNTASGANWTTPAISVSTTYYATALGSCESLVRTPVFVEVKPVPGLIIATPNVTVCGENSIIQLDATGNNEVAYLINEDFEAGTLGVFSNINSDATSAAAKAKTAWKNKTSIYVPNGNRWFPAITSNFGANKFVLTSMDDFTSVPLPTVPMQNSLTLTTSVNPSATTFANLTLTFKIFYSRYFADGTNNALENCNIEVSTNGGTTWVLLPGGQLTADQGYGSNFVTLTYNLNAYIASNNLKIRIRVLGDGSGSGTAGDGVAIDDVKLFGDRPLTPFFSLGGGVDAFTDAATTIPYVGDQRNTIWIKPTITQLEQPAFIINVTANLNNGCTTGGVVNVTNNTKIWKGTVSSDWNNAANWGPATVPTIANCVIIPTATPNPTILSTGAAGNGKNLLIKTGGVLEIQSGNALTIKEIVDVNATGTFNIKDNSSLVQIDNLVNPTVAGTFNMERIADLRSRDYCYWSSPVGNLLAGTFPITSVSPLTPTSLIFNWLTTGANSYGGQGNWVNTTENMIPTKGYIVRGPSTFNNVTTTPLTANFIGTPNNGTFTTTIFRGTDLLGTSPVKTITDDNWNLLGNPYPSAIGVNEFLNANSFAVPTNDIQGFVKIWTHGQLPTNVIDPFYQDFSVNYYPSDYISVNKTAATSGPGDVMIGAGQGFMVLMDDGVAGSSTVTFNNTMRNATFTNSTFYKNGSSAHANTTVERNRMWLDLVTPTGSVNRTVVGYVDGATQAKDNLYDAFTDYKSSENFYSLIDDEPMVIQGRSLPFDANDIVPMGVKIPSNGTYNIAIAAVDGLFAGNTQTIYLEDKLLNVIHNLTASQYQFTANQGIVNDRFVLRYNNALANNEFDSSNDVKIFANNSINISSISQSIKEVVVYDVLGKVLVNKTNIGKKEIALNELKRTTNVLIVKVILENHEVVVKKVIF